MEFLLRYIRVKLYRKGNFNSYHFKQFTILELMMVIVIFLILVALLLPALHTARFKAQKVICIENQKQCYLGVTMFMKDNKGEMPPFNPLTSSNPHKIRDSHRNYYFYYNNKIRNLAYAYEAEYITEGQIFYCPLQEDERHVIDYYMPYWTKDHKGRVRTDYFYNPETKNDSVRIYTNIQNIDSGGIFMTDNLHKVSTIAHDDLSWSVTFFDGSSHHSDQHDTELINLMKRPRFESDDFSAFNQGLDLLRD